MKHRPYCSFVDACRPSVFWISRQEALSVISWARFTSLKASRAGECTSDYFQAIEAPSLRQHFSSDAPH